MNQITVYFNDVNIEPVTFESFLRYTEIQDIVKNGLDNDGTFYPPDMIKKIIHREVADDA